jgi:hypothetical protein
MDQARIDVLRRFHTAGQSETIMGWSQANDAIQECLNTIERLQSELETAAAIENTMGMKIVELQNEIERLTKERVIFTARSVIVTEDEAREMFPDAEAKPPASD